MAARQQWEPLEHASEVFDRALIDIELLVVEHGDVYRPPRKLVAST
jgi:hypothetical protein